MKQYIDLLKDLVNNGNLKAPAREGMPGTLEVFGYTIRHDLRQGFPLLTTKKLSINNILHELLWFISGDTNILYLIKNKCNIWNQDAYRYYRHLLKEHADGVIPLDFPDFLEKVYTREYSSHIPNYVYGDLGNVYGKQWRDWEGTDQLQGFDQLTALIRNIQSQPNSRYHIVTAWNPTDFKMFTHNAALPACHMMFQCNVRDGKYLDLMVIQRSCDTFLGVPYNIASYAILIHMIAMLTGYEPGELIWTGSSVHLYENHISQANTQIQREPLPLPTLKIKHRGQQLLHHFKFEDFELVDYQSHKPIKGDLSVGK